MDLFQWASLLGVGGWVLLIIKAVIDRKATAANVAKAYAEKDNIITKTATEMLVPLNKQIDFLESRLDWALAKIANLNEQLDRANDVIKELRSRVE